MKEFLKILMLALFLFFIGYFLLWLLVVVVSYPVNQDLNPLVWGNGTKFAISGVAVLVGAIFVRLGVDLRIYD